MSLPYSNKLGITKGEWKMNSLSQPPTIFTVDGKGRPHCIAVMSWDEEAQVVLANTRLIITAPRLYDVLNGMVHQLKTVQTNNRRLGALIIDALRVLRDAEEGTER